MSLFRQLSRRVSLVVKLLRCYNLEVRIRFPTTAAAFRWGWNKNKHSCTLFFFLAIAYVLCTKFNYRICVCQASQRGGVTSLVPAIFTKNGHTKTFMSLSMRIRPMCQKFRRQNSYYSHTELVQRQARYQVYERRPSAGTWAWRYIYACKMVSCFYLLLA